MKFLQGSAWVSIVPRYNEGPYSELRTGHVQLEYLITRAIGAARAAYVVLTGINS